MNTLPAVPAPAKILVIDDNPIIQRTIYFALRDRGYTVLMSGDISVALNLVRKEKPELILLDINFPLEAATGSTGGRDGFWALDWMRRMDEVNGVPIIVISSNDPAESESRALTAGAAAYFQKPINKEALATTIAGLLAKKSSTPPPPRDSARGSTDGKFPDLKPLSLRLKSPQ